MTERRSNPAVSVLVPTYNVEEYLGQCLDALVGQTLREIEVVVIDDGSTDGSGRIADDFAARDDRVRVLHKENSGYGDSMNRGLDAACAPWIAICEPDDYVEPCFCQHLLECTEAMGGDGQPVDIVKASYTRIVHDEEGRATALPGVFHEIVDPGRQPFTIDECPALLTAHPSIWTALYRRAFLDEFGIRFLPIPGAGWADNPFFIETMVAARAIAYLDEELYNYREFEDATISHLADWRVITGRWADMMRVLERYDVAVPSILEAHACRGCAYLEMLAHDFDAADPELAKAAREMAATLDLDLVRRSTVIPKEYKLAYARYLTPLKRAKLLASWISLQVRALPRRFR